MNVRKIENKFVVKVKDGEDIPFTAARLEVGACGELNIIAINLAGVASTSYTIGCIAPGEWIAWKAVE